MPLVEEIKYVGVWFMSDGSMEQEMEGQTGTLSTVMSALLWLVVVKKA